MNNEHTKTATPSIMNIIRTRKDYLSYASRFAKEMLPKVGNITRLMLDIKELKISGDCEICESTAEFLIDWIYSDTKTPNLRERLVCGTCGLNNRQRLVFSITKQIIQNHKLENPHIFAYEQITPFFQSLKKHLTVADLIGSEYIGDTVKSGTIVNEIRHEDAMSLSFPEDSFDIVISNDVFEHVPDFKKSFCEASRVLRPSGVMIFTIPFHSDRSTTEPRAIINNGAIEHVKEAQFHGNPMSEKGSLVFHDFGWDVLDIAKASGFKDVYILEYFSLEKGYIGTSPQFVFIAENREVAHKTSSPMMSNPSI